MPRPDKHDLDVPFTPGDLHNGFLVFGLCFSHTLPTTQEATTRVTGLPGVQSAFSRTMVLRSHLVAAL